MAKYLIDTDIASYAIKGFEKVAGNFVGHDKDELYISSITYAELMFGAVRKKSGRLKSLVAAFAKRLRMVDFDEVCSELYAGIRTDLEKAGTALDHMDILIAASAMSIGAVLITHNTKHFSKIKGLKVEDWS
ncbi:MAG: type II toxin-antitoxin system VapC family toxin [Treponema sp.]|jgi:predicted nucleic acid-binding protein|nr:type II toxin-antitoxin system VapC family toxin [Treponema sp.]